MLKTYCCLICGGDIPNNMAPYRMRERKYCSWKCSGLGQRKSANGTAPYKSRYVPDGHPLRTPGSKTISAHRAVLWDKIGPGPHPCHHCSQQVNWRPGARVGKGVLIADHLDRDTRNNDPENLVPCCTKCNRERAPHGREIKEGELTVTIRGRLRRAIIRVCEECGEGYPSAPSHRSRKYCSLRCSGVASSRARKTETKPD